MWKAEWLLRAVLMLAVSAVTAVQGDEPPAGRQQAARLDTTTRVEMAYLLYLPTNYDEQEQWPLVLFLHGSGERGSDLERVKVHARQN